MNLGRIIPFVKGIDSILHFSRNLHKRNALIFRRIECYFSKQLRQKLNWERIIQLRRSFRKKGETAEEGA